LSEAKQITREAQITPSVARQMTLSEAKQITREAQIPSERSEDKLPVN
jgi:ribosomal protein S6